MKAKSAKRQSDDLPQITDLQQWERESQRLLVAEKAIRRRRLAIEKFVAAAKAANKALADEGPAVPKPRINRARTVRTVRASMLTKPKLKTKRRPRGSWTEGVLEIIEGANRPISPGEVKMLAQVGPLAQRLKQGDKGFYGAIGKLAAKKQIVKHRGYLFSIQAYDEFQRKLTIGEIKDLKRAYTGAHSSPAKDAILRYLRVNPSGATMGQIIAELEKDPELAAAIKRSRNSIYNLVLRLVKRRVLNRRGSILRYSQQNEALSGSLSASNGSVGGEGGSSPSIGLAAASTG